MSRSYLLSPETELELFKTESGIVEFVVMEEELQSLFNYCLLFQEASEDKVKDLKNEVEELENHPQPESLNERVFSKADFIHGLKDFEIPHWKNLLEITVPLNQIILAYTFLERSLKSICSEYSPDNDSRYFRGFNAKIKQQRGESIIRTCLGYLTQECGLAPIQMSEELEFIDTKIRSLRNNFVHGDWEACEDLISELKMNDFFISISNLLDDVEGKCVKHRNSLKKRG